MHVLVSCGILVWSLVHVTLHFVSFAVTTNNATAPLSTSERFAKNLLTHLGPTITGFIIALLFLTLALSSIGPIRRVLRFIPFYIIHWVCLCVFYLLLVIHGVGYFNHSYWPWLLPFALVVLLERVYRYTAITRHSVRVDCAGRYDDQSRTAIIELERPPKFKFEPGQYMLLNLPWIGTVYTPMSTTLSPFLPFLPHYPPLSSFLPHYPLPFSLSPPLSPFLPHSLSPFLPHYPPLSPFSPTLPHY